MIEFYVVSILLLIVLSPYLLLICSVLLISQKTGGDDYPYPLHRLYRSEKDVDVAFESIKNYKLEIVPAEYSIANMPELTPAQKNFIGSSVLCKMSLGDYEEMNWLSDWFNEQCRIKCTRYDEKQSPEEYWETHGKDISSREKSHRKMNDMVYEKVKGCNNFRPGLARGLIRLFGARSVLDPCAGWGDRLIGAIAAGVRYTGVDPNDCLFEGYSKIIEKFAGENEKSLYNCVKSPFQSYEITDNYDLVMTSPPYFNLEIYSTDPSQSTATYSDVDSWFDGFLMVSLRKAWSALNPGGHMVIIINNTRGKKDYVERMISNVNSAKSPIAGDNSIFEDADYLGMLPYADHTHRGYKSPQPMWIWRKITDINIEKLDDSHVYPLYEITSDPDVMKYIANGKTWSVEKIKGLISYEQDDRYFHYAVKMGFQVIGYVGLYPLDPARDKQDNISPEEKSKVQVRIFLSKMYSRKGYGKSALELLLGKHSDKKIYYQFHEENIPSKRLAEKMNFSFVGKYKISGVNALRYSI